MAAASSSSSSSPQYRSRFGDTTWTKVFVGGLAWETPTEELRRYFEQFGDILEAVVITDKATGRSKGYGFVTFRDAEAAKRSVADPNPVIDGRRSNCNIASLGRPRTSPRQARSQEGRLQQGPPQAAGPAYGGVPAQVPHPMIYPTPFGYVAYPSDYGYHQQSPAALYNPQMAASYYYQQMYGPTSPSNISPTGTYHYSPHQPGYPMQGPTPPRASFPSLPQGQQQQQQQGQRSPFMGAAPLMGMGFGQIPSSSHVETGFHLQLPPHARQPQQQPLNPSSIGSQQAPQQAASSGGANSADEHDQDA